MIPYRLFPTNACGRITGPPELIEAESDQQALQSAQTTFGDRVGELWDGARRVAQLPSFCKAETSSAQDDALTGLSRS